MRSRRFRLDVSSYRSNLVLSTSSRCTGEEPEWRKQALCFVILQRSMKWQGKPTFTLRRSSLAEDHEQLRAGMRRCHCSQERNKFLGMEGRRKRQTHTTKSL
jgi:hypothetical protein